MTTEATTALINIAPERDEVIIKLQYEATSLKTYADALVITSNDQLIPATNDLSLIAKLKKAIEERRKDWVNPIRASLDAVNGVFKTLIEPLEEADRTTRAKIMAFRQEQERKRREVEAIEAEKLALAKREAELKGGEITIDLTPIEKPEALPAHVFTDLGTMGTVKIKKWEVENLELVPREYLIIDATKIGKVVRAGIPSIPGIRIWTEETLKVNTK